MAVKVIRKATERAHKSKSEREHTHINVKNSFCNKALQTSFVADCLSVSTPCRLLLLQPSFTVYVGARGVSASYWQDVGPGLLVEQLSSAS